MNADPSIEDPAEVLCDPNGTECPALPSRHKPTPVADRSGPPTLNSLNCRPWINPASPCRTVYPVSTGKNSQRNREAFPVAVHHGRIPAVDPIGGEAADARTHAARVFATTADPNGCVPRWAVNFTNPDATAVPPTAAPAARRWNP